MRLNWRIKYRQLLYWDYLVCLWHEYHFFYIQRLSIVVLGESFCVIFCFKVWWYSFMHYSIQRNMLHIYFIGIFRSIISMLIYLFAYTPWTSLIHSYCHPLGEGSFNPRCNNNWSITDHCQLWPTMVTKYIYIYCK